MNNHELAAQVALAAQRLPRATAEEAQDGKKQFLHQVIHILSSLPSAKIAELSTENMPGWQGGPTVTVVILSDEDDANVARLNREWNKAQR